MDEGLKSGLLACLIEDSADAVCALDASGAVAAVSPGAAELFGLTRDEALGRPFARLLAEPEEARALLDAAARSGQLRNRRTTLAAADGSRERAALSLRALRGDSAGAPPAGYLLELAPLAAEFASSPDERSVQEALVRMERFSAIGRLAAAFAHEMRTPLHVIASTAELALEDSPEGSPARERAELILRNARLAGLSVQALLDFAKLGKSHLREGSLNDALRGALGLMEKTCERQGIAVATDYGELPPQLFDERPLRAVLHNLLVNAIEAMPQGGTLAVATRHGGDGRARVEIRDTGSGMAPEVLSQAGTAFFTTKENGTGLGLYLARRILTEHGAELSFESSLGKGTAAAILFPAR